MRDPASLRLALFFFHDGLIVTARHSHVVNNFLHDAVSAQFAQTIFPGRLFGVVRSVAQVVEPFLADALAALIQRTP